MAKDQEIDLSTCAACLLHLHQHVVGGIVDDGLAVGRDVGPRNWPVGPQISTLTLAIP